MSDEFLTPFRRNEFVWKEREQVEVNKLLKMRFKQAMTRLKESFRIEYEPDEDLEGVD